VKATDDIIWDAEALRVGLILFRPRTCTTCGMTFPANTDYFAPNKQNLSGLTHNCRRCRRVLSGKRVRRKIPGLS